MGTNKFRSAINTRYLKGLFYEQTGADKSSVVYTLKDIDHNNYPSMYRLYMELDDPTEWKVATTLVDGWEHWEMLTSCSWFKPYVDRWRKELEVRMRSIALNRIKTESKISSKDSFMANKYILEKGWEPKETSTSKRGRPTNDEIKKAANEAASAEARLSADFSRMINPTIPN